MQCKTTGKLMIPHIKAAKRKKKRVEQRFNNKLGIYICPFCKHYHLTTK